MVSVGIFSGKSPLTDPWNLFKEIREPWGPNDALKDHWNFFKATVRHPESQIMPWRTLRIFPGKYDRPRRSNDALGIFSREGKGFWGWNDVLTIPWNFLMEWREILGVKRYSDEPFEFFQRIMRDLEVQICVDGPLELFRQKWETLRVNWCSYLTFESFLGIKKRL